MATGPSSAFINLLQPVEFLDVKDQYSSNEDLLCQYKLNNYKPQEGDRVAIFKLGWSNVKDYLVFEWASLCSNESLCSVTFDKTQLPKDFVEMYQICYLNAENEIHGASCPITITPSDSEMSASVLKLPARPVPDGMTKSLSSSDQAEKDEIINKLKEENKIIKNLVKQAVEARQDDQMAALREENSRLKYLLKAAITSGLKDNGNIMDTLRQASANADCNVEEYKKLVDDLQASIISEQDKEIKVLKEKVRQGGEEYRKLYLEKREVERKYEKLRGKKDKKMPNADNFDIGDFKSIPPPPVINIP